MIEVTPTIFFTVFGSYTFLLVGCIMWFNNKFNEISDAIRDRVSMTSYEEKHNALEIRVRNLEIQIAGRQRIP